MKFTSRLWLIAVALLFSVCSATSGLASSTTLQFVLTNTSTGNIYRFSLPSMPTGQWTGPDQFDLLNVPYTVNGTPAAPAQFSFYDTAQAGGFEISYGFGQMVIVNPTGPQLWTGTPQAPTFITGRFLGLPDYSNPDELYNLFIIGSSTGGGGGGGSQPPVPEPSTVWLLGSGAIAAVKFVRNRAQR